MNKTTFPGIMLAGFLNLACCSIQAGDITVVAPTSAAAENMDLTAVAELFKSADSLEAFEKTLNDPDEGLNNLDLDGDGQVDYVRVLEQATGRNHLIILQAMLGEEEYQDVATIAVEDDDSGNYTMDVHGDGIIYGPDYYVAPVVHVRAWPIVRLIFRPTYQPYRSVFYFGHYPRWWHPFHPLHVTAYRRRTVIWTGRASFNVTQVHSVTRVHYTARTSIKVKHGATVAHKGKHGKTVVHEGKHGKTVAHKGKHGKTVAHKGKQKGKDKKGGS